MMLGTKILVIVFFIFAVSGCGKEGDAIAPSGAGSAISTIKADCDGSSCI